MKQRILVAAASLVLAALILLLLPTAPPETTPTTVPTVPTTNSTTSPTTPGTTAPPPPPVGVVRFYSCDPTIQTLLTDMAASYTAQTGLEVVILSQEEDGCQATLQRLMESEDPPTAFCVHSRNQLLAWEPILLDLKASSLAPLLRSEDMAIRANGKWLALPMGLKGYGLLMNAELLAGVALTRSDITEFSSLSTAAQILKNNSLKAFSLFSPTEQAAWQLLAVQEPERAREFLDLYLANHSTKNDGLTQFLSGKSAFMLGDSSAYDLLASYTDQTFHVRNLDILPTYIGGAMQYFCDWAWCINGSVRQEDIAATIAFLAWMVTPTETEAAPIDLLQLLTPFAGSSWYGNQLEKKLLGYMSEEPAITDFNDGLPENESLLTALNAYLQAPTDENWEQLRLCMDQLRAQPIPE